MIKNKKAFTLAEVLISLTLIGVVAVLTKSIVRVPDVNDAYLRTQWRKTFTEFSNVTKQIAWEHDGLMTNLASTHNEFRNLFTSKKLTTVKTCDQGASVDECWHNTSNFTYYNNSTYGGSSWSTLMSRAILENGTLIAFRLDSNTCTSSLTPNNDNCGALHIDVNGFKPPNSVGKDIFAFYVRKNGTITPLGAQGVNAAGSCKPTDSGWGCSSNFLHGDEED